MGGGKVKLIPEAAREPVPAREGKLPVASEYAPVPPLMVADPVPEPLRTFAGIFSVPLILSPVVNVIVNGALKFPDGSGDKETVPLNVPLPILVRVAGPLAVIPEPPTVPVACTVRLVFTVAACNPAHIVKPNAQPTSFRIMMRIPPSL